MAKPIEELQEGVTNTNAKTQTQTQAQPPGAGLRLKGGECVLEPQSFTVGAGVFELSMHRPTRMLERELQHIFPTSLPKCGAGQVLVIPTAQQAGIDLLGLSVEVAQEKDRLLERFVTFCKQLHETLKTRGFWFDFCDPASGLPMFEAGGSVFSDVECFERLRKYRTSQAGGCKVVYHPTWGSSFYPSTMFTNCPVDQFVQCLEMKVNGSAESSS